MTNQPVTIFDHLGEENLHKLVDQFYDRVSADDELTELFPDDLTETRRKQKQFLTQFFGGQPLYTEEHGHPMLRARHMPFKITETKAQAWLACMAAALVDTGIEKNVREAMFDRLSHTAKHMINSTDDETIRR
ncbi:globin [Salisediminibacterium halotolerans]|uniref:Hemoglobin n=1 Tax=Salisediminibacterium halotolerans TaxID=517425 RepID=A0A1H9VDY8_9BACI|nr:MULTISPECIES: globin [Salisediminibacterium]RLJ74438.1 hemoglobin [Actinophytocola xinjiangensis]RPE87469.1 hemoglobin [Salisediminibacterium halotolerans]TWG35274.1 hemoglobin [Salisediminibacterium halotolerans]SES19788.1 hemoglobin [Salisediminibacterium haloalkalitolerans]GEL06755.1 hypothetical protein SHA02_01710 [Salisediminibacterium halotolerans]